MRIKELPYFLTLLFSLLGISVKYLSDKILSATFVEYRLIDNHENSRNYYDCIIQNVSEDKAFKNLFFNIFIEDTTEGKFVKAWIESYPPFFQSDRFVQGQNIGMSYANFVITDLIPNSKFKLRVAYEGKIKPQFIFKAEQSGNGNPPYNFKEHSFFTWIAKNEFQIIFGLIAFWSISIILYLLKLKNTSNANESTKPIPGFDAIGLFFWSKEK
jgi:hypothetical protein